MYKAIILSCILLLAGCGEKMTGQAMLEKVDIPLGYVAPIEKSEDPIQVWFCPSGGCGDALTKVVLSSTQVDCAFFDLDLPQLILALESKQARVVIDDMNREAFLSAGSISRTAYDTSSQYSHNKFCVLDREWVFTGSFNPTMNGDKKNDNNALLINSQYLASNYQEEFDELWEGRFGKGERTYFPGITWNGIHIENYFCPDDCKSIDRDGYGGGEERLVTLIDSANESVEMAIFSLTLDSVGDAIIRARDRGVRVAIVLENQQKNVKGSEYKKLLDAGIDIVIDKNPAAMHHKFVIVDRKVVWTGSYNFSGSANERNDENILIIYDAGLAEIFGIEFIRLIERDG